MAKYKAYPEYKESGVEWLGKVPEHWEVGSLRWKIRIFSGEGLATNLIERFSSRLYRIPVIGGNGLMGYTSKPNIKKSVIAIGRVGALCGNAHLINKESWITDNALVIDRWKGFNYYYLYNLIKSLNLNSLASRTAQPLITGELIKNLRVPLPSIKEQFKIANFLDHETAKIDKLIEKQEKLIELLQEKRQAVISHAVTKGLDSSVAMKDSGVEWLGEVPEHWSISKLKYILNAIGDVDHYMPKTTESGVPYIMTGDLRDLASQIDFENCKKISQESYRSLSQKIKTVKGDVILARYATVGTVCYVDIDYDFIVSYSCVTIQPNILIVMGMYLFYYFQTDAFKQSIQGSANTNTQANVGINDLENLEVSLPCIKEQNKIVSFLDIELKKFDSLIDKAMHGIKLMKERRTALISAAVTGKIDVRDVEIA